MFSYSMGEVNTKFATKLAEATGEQYAKAIAERGKQILDMEFTIEGTDEGPWKQLADSTVKRKGFSAILYETGDLMKSTFARKTGKGWSFGVESDKFDPNLHEFGFFNIISGTWVPARPMVGPALRQVEREKPAIKKDVEQEFISNMGDLIV